MLLTAFRQSKHRLLLGLGCVAVAGVGLAGVAHPLWAAVLAGLAAPWLVLGRDAGRARAGVREGVRLAPDGGRWVLAELAPPLAVVAIAAIVGARGAPIVALCLFTWFAALVTLADALDRRGTHAASAWTTLCLGVAPLLTLPVWLAGWFSEPGLGHWPASLAVALHPAGMAISASGHAALQDPVFYRWTLSGVVEAHPLSWGVGAAFYATLALGGVFLTLRAARQPSRTLIGVTDARHPIS